MNKTLARLQWETTEEPAPEEPAPDEPEPEE